MENGPSLHYNRNTVKLPHPGKKRLRKNRKAQSAIHFEGKMPQNREHKVAVVKRCVWCSFTSLDQWFITCPICKNCQYCGMVDLVDPYRCYLCGNFLPERLRVKNTKLRAHKVNNITDRRRRKDYDKDGSSATIESVNNNMAAQQGTWK